MNNGRIPPSETEQLLLAYLPKFPAIISFLSSVCVIVSVSRSNKKKKKMYHRIACVMAFYGILQSCIFMIGTTAFPKNTPQVKGAAGTYSSCTVQGFFVQLTMAIPYYYSSLSVYSFLAIRNDFNQERIAWVEKWIHGIVHILTVPSAVYLVPKDAYNPSGPFCWISRFPLDCGPKTGVTCIRSSPRSLVYSTCFVAIPAGLSAVMSFVIMARIYRTQVKKEKESEMKNHGKKKFLAAARKKKSGIIAKQACLYLFAFILGYGPSAITRTLKMLGKKSSNYFWVFSACMTALQSSFFTFVYFWLQIRNGPMQFDGISRMSFSRQRNEKSPSDLRMSLGPEEKNEIPEEPKRRLSFSIFDGSQVTTNSPWSMFLVDDSGDSDSSDDDSEKQVDHNVLETEMVSTCISNEVNEIGTVQNNYSTDCNVD